MKTLDGIIIVKLGKTHVNERFGRKPCLNSLNLNVALSLAMPRSFLVSYYLRRFTFTEIYCSREERAEPEMSVRLFGSSIEPDAKTIAQIARIIKEHWGVENLNHWKRDATYWREDRVPKRNPRGAKNLALLRNALLAAIPFECFTHSMTPSITTGKSVVNL